MVVTLTDDKKEIIVQETDNLMNKDYAKIRDVARVLSLLVSSFSAVDFGRLF